MTKTEVLDLLGISTLYSEIADNVLELSEIRQISENFYDAEEVCRFYAEAETFFREYLPEFYVRKILSVNTDDLLKMKIEYIPMPVEMQCIFYDRYPKGEFRYSSYAYNSIQVYKVLNVLSKSIYLRIPVKYVNNYKASFVSAETAVTTLGFKKINPELYQVTETTKYSWDGQPLQTKDALGTITDYEYDKRGLLLSVTKTDSKGEKYTTAYAYDIAARKTIEVSPLNYKAGTELSSLNRTEYVYDLMGRVRAQKDIYKKNPDDASFTTIVSKAYKYDLNGNVIKELDGRGYEAGTGSDIERINTGYGIQYTYDLSNRKLTVLDAVSDEMELSFTAKYAYDGAGRTISETDANGAIKNYIYDDAGNVLRVTSQKTISSPALLLKECKYNLIGNVLEETDGNRNTTAYEYNLLGKVRKIFYPSDSSIEGYVVTCKYDVKGNLVQKQDSMGVVDVFAYDRQGRQLTYKQQSSDAKDTISTSTAYDLNGNKRFETDANGTTTENIYDSLNKLITTKVSVRNAGGDPVLHTTTLGYDKNGNQTTTTDWLGNKTTNTYDALNRVVEKADPYGTVQKIEYNSSHLQVKSYETKDKNEDGSLNFVATTFTYDKGNRLVSTTDPEGYTTSQNYDKVGNIAAKTDGNGNVTTYDYDELKHLASVTNTKGEKTSYTYDLNGNMISQTDGKGNTSLFEYNSINKIVRKIDAGGRKGNAGSYTYTASKTEVYTYYGDGSLKTKTDRNNVVTYYEYDIHGRMLKEKAKDTTVEYTYDGNGNQLTMKDSTGITIRTYDELGRVVTKTVGNLGTSTFQYDVTEGVEQGQYAEISKDLKGNETKKIFDKVGRLAEVRDGDQTTGTKYEYNPNGSTASVTYPNGSQEVYTYYDNHLLNTLEHYFKEGYDYYSYTYDGAHNQLTKSEYINCVDQGITNYTYDKLNRLSMVAEPGGKTTEYSYDKAGNREIETVTLGSTRTLTTYTYNEQNRLTSTVQQQNDRRTTIKYGYDNNGNLTSELASQIRKIDPLKPPEAHFGMFIAGQEKDGATMFAQDIGQYQQYFEYDVFNQMIKSSIGTSSGEYTYYGDGKRATATTNDKTTKFIYEASQVTLELDSKGNESARNIYGNNLVTRTISAGSVYYMYNGHGDVTTLMRTDGSFLANYRYDAFGNVLDEVTKFNLTDIDNPYTYGGYRYDNESGMYYLNARYYDSTTARFMSEDTYKGAINDPLSLNLYTYCHNEPVMYSDPSGNTNVTVSWGGFIIDIDSSELADYKSMGWAVYSGNAYAPDMYNYSNNVSSINISAGSSSTIVNCGNIGTVNVGAGSTAGISNSGNINVINTGAKSTTTITNSGTINTINSGTNSTTTINNTGTINTIDSGANSITNIYNSGTINAFNTGTESNNIIYNNGQIGKVITGSGNSTSIYDSGLIDVVGGSGKINYNYTEKLNNLVTACGGSISWSKDMKTATVSIAGNIIVYKVGENGAYIVGKTLYVSGAKFASDFGGTYFKTVGKGVYGYSLSINVPIYTTDVRLNKLPTGNRYFVSADSITFQNSQAGELAAGKFNLTMAGCANYADNMYSALLGATASGIGGITGVLIGVSIGAKEIFGIDLFRAPEVHAGNTYVSVYKAYYTTSGGNGGYSCYIIP